MQRFIVNGEDWELAAKLTSGDDDDDDDNDLFDESDIGLSLDYP